MLLTSGLEAGCTASRSGRCAGSHGDVLVLQICMTVCTSCSPTACHPKIPGSFLADCTSLVSVIDSVIEQKPVHTPEQRIHRSFQSLCPFGLQWGW